MPAYIIYSLIFALGRAVVFIVQKIVSKEIEKDWRVYSFLYYLSAIVISGLIYLFFPWPVSLFKDVFLSAFFLFLGGVTLNYCVYNLDLSVIGNLQSLKLIFVALLAVFLLNETYSFWVYFLMVILILGSCLVVVDDKLQLSDFFNRKVLIAIVSLLFFALSDTLAGLVIKDNNAFTFFGATLSVDSVLSLILIPFVYQKLRNLKAKNVGIVTVNAWLIFGVIIFLLMAFQDNVTISNSISNLTGPFVLIFSIVLSQFSLISLEHHSKKVYSVRILGAIIAYLSAFGIVMLS